MEQTIKIPLELLRKLVSTIDVTDDCVWCGMYFYGEFQTHADDCPWVQAMVYIEQCEAENRG